METRVSITLRNDFHGTTANVISKDGIISARAMRNAENQLCGCEGCTCGGTRGIQDAYLVQREDRDWDVMPNRC